MKAVIDTSVLVSYLLSPRGAGAWLLAFWRDERYDLVTSPALVAELVDVLDRPHIAGRVDQYRKLALLRRLRHNAIWVAATAEATGATPDPGDDMLVSAALEAKADVIVTWDGVLLAHGTSRDIPFVDPNQFISILQSA